MKQMNARTKAALQVSVVVLALCAGCALLIPVAWDLVDRGWSSIQDPTERGLAYVATAIAVHALCGTSRPQTKDS